MRLTRAGFVVAVFCCLSLALAAPGAPAERTGRTVSRMYDARFSPPREVAQRIAASRAAGDAAAAGAEVRAVGVAVEREVQRRPSLEVRLSSVTGAPAEVGDREGALTPPAPGRGSEEIVRAYLLDHGAMFGLSAADLGDLVALGDSPGGTSGLRMLRMEQRIAGRPVFQSETRFLLDREGRLVKIVGYLVPHARRHAPTGDSAWRLGAEQAVASLLGSIGETVDPKAFRVTKSRDGLLELKVSGEIVAGPVTAREVLFPVAPGVIVPAWSLVVFTSGDHDWYAIVDAETGAVLWRKDIRSYASTHEARFRVYVQADGVTPADSPAPQSPSLVAPGSGTQFGEIAPTIVNMSVAQDIVASPNGWIDDCPGGVCTANETQTLGNNVLACLDRTVGADANICDTNAAGVIDGNGRPTGNPDADGRNRDFLGTSPRDFETGFLPPPQGGAGGAETGQTATGAGASGTNVFDQFRRGSITNQFYGANWYHDRLFALGFDEASGNFQQLNFSGMGLGGDRVLVDVEDQGTGAQVNNANFSTPPDGVSGRAQMFRFTGPIIDRDGGLDNVVYFHELTHGTSNRLVGNAAGLNWDPAVGMGEGWSDFYALSLLNNTNADDPDGQYAAGAYATYKLGGLLDNYLYAIRRFPYTTDNSINPLTWADVDDVTYSESGGIASNPLGFAINGAMEVHNAGELWASTLWEVRSRVIADPAGANGDVPTGNQTMLQLVTDGLKMTPNDPQFIDARDAILDADCATNACANEDSIWSGFADRGLGYGAAEPYSVAIALAASHLGVQESFGVPYLDVVDPGSDVAVDDTFANNNGAIDPGEPVRLDVSLTNPWRGAAKAVTSATATLTTSTAGVTILDDTAAYGAIAPLATVAGSDTFLIVVDPGVPCGSAIDFTLTVTSDLGTTAADFSVRVGAASGTDPVVTYTGDPNPDLAIPDNRPRGVVHQLNVTDDLVIADLDFRVDSISHSFVDDLVVLLRAPGGIGIDLVSLIGLNGDGGGGNNLTNFVVDDDLPFVLSEDMISAVSAQYNSPGDWIPVYNSPTFANPLFFGVPPDPVGNLTRFDGLRTLGTWSVLAADEFAADTGTLNSWSMLVTPVHFACTPFVAAPAVSATKTVSGTFTEGGNVTYTVTLINDGSADQGDNPGDEFSDTLPAGLTLTGASSSSGTAAAGGNLVTWNGSIPLLGGSVTLTITATVNAGTVGTQQCNQGTTLYDADNDDVNESMGVTDDPGTGAANDPTCFTVGGGFVDVTATKTASGSFEQGSTVTYTVVLTNDGNLPQADNPGFEFTDTLPAGLILTGADDGGDPGTFANAANTVNWNGTIAANGGTVTITIQATVTASPGQTVSNQGQASFDADGNGSNESSAPTDDPGTAPADDPTEFVVAADLLEIPALSLLGILLLGLTLAGAALLALRRQG